MDVFGFEILDEKGRGMKMNIPESSPAYMDFLNFLCGANPVEWIDHTSHNKIILCNKDFKLHIAEICDKYLAEIPELSQAKEFFLSQEENAYLAFLRSGVLGGRSEEKLRELARFMLDRRRFLSCYDVEVFGDEEKLTGPEYLSDCVCRFCNRDRSKTKFKKKNAHAIPQSIGNNLVFCNDECVNCNGKLSIVDKEIGEYLKFRRSAYKILNKNNKIIHVTGHNFDYDGKTEVLKISKYAILDETDDSYYIKLEGAEPITHLCIYKSLAKIAIDLMPRECVDDFRATVRWIRGEFTPYKVPDVIYGYRKKTITQPIATVYTRKDGVTDDELPRCMVRLDVMDLAYFYIVPLASGEYNLSSDSLLPYLSFLTDDELKKYEGRIVFEKLDMADRIGKFSHVKEWIRKEDCKIVDQSEFLFQEKNPNVHDFPYFDSSKVCIGGNEIAYAHISNKPDIATLRIHDVAVVDADTSITPVKMPYSTILKLQWSCRLIKIDSGEDVVRAAGEVCAMPSAIDDVLYFINPDEYEASSHLTEYMLDAAFELLGQHLKSSMPDFEFDELAAFTMESMGHVMHFNEDAEQSVIPH